MSRQKTKNKIAEVVGKVGPVRFGLLLVMGYIASLNIEPWANLTANHLSNPDALVVGLFYRIPIIGGWLQNAGWLAGLAIGVAPWAVVQTFQVLPTVMESNRQNLANAIEGLKRNSRGYGEDPNADEELGRLIRKYNELPVKTLKGFYVARIIAYALDAAVVLSHYPLLIGGWAELKWGIPLPSQVDFDNIWKTVAILFVFQQLVAVYLWVGNVNRYLVSEEVVA